MSDTVSVRVPAELYRRLEAVAKRKATTAQAELVRCLEAGLGSGKERGRPLKQFIPRAYDDVVDLRVLREVLKKGNALEAIKRLTGEEPYQGQGKELFKSLGRESLYRRHTRLKQRLAAAGRLPTKPADVVWDQPYGGTSLELDMAWEMVSLLNRWDSKQPLVAPVWMIAVLESRTAHTNLAIANRKLAAAEADLAVIRAFQAELEADGTLKAVGKK